MKLNDYNELDDRDTPAERSAIADQERQDRVRAALAAAGLVCHEDDVVRLYMVARYPGYGQARCWAASKLEAAIRLGTPAASVWRPGGYGHRRGRSGYREDTIVADWLPADRSPAPDVYARD